MLPAAAPAGRIYLPFVATAIAVAIIAGFLSGTVVAAGRLLDTNLDVTARLISTHQVAQTWGFIGLFVIGMCFRLLPIWTRRPLRLAYLAPAIWLSTVLAILLNFGALVSLPAELNVASACALLLAAMMFLAVTAATVLGRSPAARPPWAFLAGAVLLVLAAVTHFVVAASDSYDYWARSAESLLFLGGFMPAFVTSAAARGFRPGRWGEEAFAIVLGAAAAALAGVLFYVEIEGERDAAIRLTGLGLLGLSTVWATIPLLSGVFNQAATRPGIGSWPHLVLLRSAFCWMLVAALIGLWQGGRALATGALPGSAALDAMLHSLGMSAFVLILGMGLLLLPDFARTPLHTRSSMLFALGLLVTLNVAAALRVGTALMASALDARVLAGAQALAGLLSEAALVSFVVALLAARASLRGRLSEDSEKTGVVHG